MIKFAILGFILIQFSISSENIPLEEKRLDIGYYLEILEDKDASLSLETVQNKQFESSKELNPSFGFTDSVYWLKFQFQNNGTSHKKKVIEITFPLIDEVTLYYPNENKEYQQIVTGMIFPFFERPIKNQALVFPIEIPLGQSVFYMRFKNEDSMQIPLVLWEPEEFNNFSRNAQYINGIYFGMLLAMLAYNIFLFISVRDKSYFYYIIYILFFALFLMSQQGLAYHYLWPNFNWGARRMNPMLAGLLEMSALLFTREFLDTKNTFPSLHKWNRILILLCFFASVSSLFLSLSVSALEVVILGLLTAISIITFGINALLKGFRPARYFMIAFSMLILGAIFYALKTFGSVPLNFFTEHSMQIGSGLEVILLSLGLADRISLLIKENEIAQKNLIIEQKSSLKKQEELNKSISRFVPSELIYFLGKKEISQVKLGDQIQKEMTVIFSDIRSFTELSEKMNPAENFSFINSYLMYMTPVIEKHGGVVDKFIGDAIMALFDSNPKNAILAALEMQKELNRYNIIRMQDGLLPIRAGIGIHRGQVMLGTIGSESRMEVTVISDTVNTASRIEGITKDFGIDILVSETALVSLFDSSVFLSRYLGKTSVKGKKEPLGIFEIFNRESKEAELFLNTKEIFEKGVTLYFERKYSESLLHFEEVNKNFQGDNATIGYIKSCKEKMNQKE